MASRKSGSSKTASRGAAGPRRQNAEQERRNREIAGILLIAAGILLAVYLFISGTGLLGQVLAEVLFGLFGFISYLMPLILIGLGVLSIRGSRSVGLRGSGWFAVLGVFSLVTLLSAIRGAAYQNVRYMDFLKDAYEAGHKAHSGGGFIGGVLCYPLQMLGGDALAFTLTIAVLLVCILAITRLSLRDMSARVGTSVHSAVERAQKERVERASERKLYTVSLADDAAGAQTRGKRIAKVENDAKSGAPRRKASKRAAGEDDALSFMPTGTLKTRDAEDVAAVKRKNDPIISDLWDDLEPSDDVPLVIKPARKPVKKDAALPDTSRLFGAHEDSPRPQRKPARVTEIAAVQPGVPAPYEPPSFSLLNAPHMTYTKTAESPNEKARLLIDTLASFNIAAKVVNISVGPVLTRFELQPAPGVRVSRITTLSNDIALALAAPRVRIEAPIPGKSAIGIEIPNRDAVTVVLRDIVESREFQTAASPITLALGKDISGKVITADLAKMPHMLIAGSTGSGKSVCINDLIISMVYKSSPADLRLILVDPKMVELSVFGTLPHLLIPVVTDPKKASGALRWAVNEMTQRYKMFSERGARDLARFNELQETPETRLPKIVIIIDELADLMLVAPDEVEDCICRVAQLGRAAGLHLIVATQRPSADVITGLIKTNIPSRCAFAVASGIDSRIILDCTGAEKLLGRGDMLFHPNGANKPTRLQCAFVSDEEVERIVDYFRVRQRSPLFDEKIVAEVANPSKSGATGGVFGEGKQEDELLGEAVRIVIESGQASISMIQRRLRVGYARAARLVDMMEQHGYVSGFDGSKPRRVLIKRSEFEQLFGESLPESDPAGGGA